MNTPDSPFLGQNCVTPYPKSAVLARWLWLFVQSTIFRWSPRPLHGFRAGLLRCFGADITGPVVIFPTAKIIFPKNLSLAPRSMIGPNVNIYNLTTVRLEYGANISQNGHLCAGTHDFKQWSMPLVTAPITIGRNAWLGADVFVGPGVSVGELCVVGARSVVVKNLPPLHICAGSPCRPIKPRPMPREPNVGVEN
ncbi:putative colanic acid biosynthesis acetyltransferase [Oleiharenicola lentus]|uniref:putative colanic acid biosynthesis acetyltransferase n=1 Tax=Oleiharenicola lentus TaxID=2508720 RepID=UPI003F66EF53